MKIREPKPNDQEMAQKCFEMFKKFTKDNPDIEPTIWMSACFSVMVSSYIISDFSFEEFQSDVSQAIEHYKDWWDEHEGF